MQVRISGILRKRWADISANVFGMRDELVYGRSKGEDKNEDTAGSGKGLGGYL